MARIRVFRAEKCLEFSNYAGELFASFRVHAAAAAPDEFNPNIFIRLTFARWLMKNIFLLNGETSANVSNKAAESTIE